MTSFEFHTEEVDRLVIDLSQADDRIVDKARPVMKRGALEIKRRMQQEFSGHRHARGVPLSFEFQQLDRNGLSYEIGELDSAGLQWGLAAILSYGTSNNAPVADHTKALRGEGEAIVSHLNDAASDAVLGGPE